MKLPATVVEELRLAITPLDTADNRDAYREGRYPRSEFTRDLNRRYRWDLLNATIPASRVCEIYDLYVVNDSHIDTALRSIVPNL